jgi:hypothetical protein
MSGMAKKLLVRLNGSVVAMVDDVERVLFFIILKDS